MTNKWAVFLIANVVFLNMALAQDAQRLDFIYFKAINQYNMNDPKNIANIVKYHGIYINNHTYSRTYTGLYESYAPPYLSALTLADNHES